MVQNIRIIFRKPFFKPGELLTGQVKFNSAVENTQVDIILRGEAKISAIGTVRFLSEDHHLMNSRQSRHASAVNRGVDGYSYDIPFDFELPDYLIPTFGHFNGSADYSVFVSCGSVSVRKTVNIISKENRVPQYITDLYSTRNKEIRVNELRIEYFLDREFFVFGDKWDGNFLLENNSNHQITNVAVWLIRTVELKFKKGTQIIDETLKLCDHRCSINPRSIERLVGFSIPIPDAIPTMKSPHVEFRYQLKLKFGTEKSFKIPIKIGSALDQNTVFKS